MPLIRLDQSIVVAAEKLTETTLTFGMPDMTFKGEVITVEISVDNGKVYSAVEKVHTTTGSLISLLPEPVPKILDYSPTVFLRAATYTVDFYGANLDKLISCSGTLTVVSETHAECALIISIYARDYQV